MQGHYGEVFRATVTAAALGGTVAVPAAVKTLKTSTDETRTALLREAALCVPPSAVVGCPGSCPGSTLQEGAAPLLTTPRAPRASTRMALFEHPHVVALLGVVTVPRNMPAMLVLEFCEHGRSHPSPESGA